MIKNNSNVMTIAGVFVGVAILGVVCLYLIMELEKQWLYMAAVLAIAYMLFMLMQDKELALMQAMIFLIQFQIGFLYFEVTNADSIFAFDVIALLLFALWFINSGGLHWKTLIKSNGFYPAAGMILWSVLSIPFAISKLSAILGLYYQIKTFLMFLLLINIITRKKEIFGILNAFMITLILQSILAIIQKVQGRPLGLGFLGEGQYSMWWELARAQGTFGYPNQFAAYLILIIPSAICLAIFVRKSLYRLFYIGVILLSVTALILTLSRSSWLGMIVAIVLIFIMTISHKRLGTKSFLFFGVVLVIAMVLVSVFYELIQLRFHSSNVQDENRMLMIRIALQLIARNPVVGCGLFNFEYHSYSIFQFWQPVHNVFLRLAAETGLPGVSFFLWFIVRVYKNAFAGARSEDKFLSMIGLGTMGGYTAFLIACQFGPEYQHYRQQTTFWILAALLIAAYKIQIQEHREQNRIKGARSQVQQRSSSGRLPNHLKGVG